MKKIVSVLTILAIVFTVSSCGNKKKKDAQPAGTHVHEDGTVHSDDAHAHPAPAQESFEVKEGNDEGGEHDGHNHEGDDKEVEDHEHGDESGHSHGEHK